MNNQNYYSHIEKNGDGRIIFSKFLYLHLLEVAKNTQNSIKSLRIENKNKLSGLAYLIGLAHDFGKYTSFFQDYLLNGNDTGNLKNHSLLSAFWAAYSIYQVNPKGCNEVYELVQKKDEYFRNLNRIQLIHDKQPKKINDFVNEFIENYDNQKSHAIILNTIKSSIEIFHLLFEKFYEHPSVLFYLSTNILPVQRQERIQKIKSLLKHKKSIILVSTQVIEAGVDLDFDFIYRDFAPIDSIIQAAGRANRNWTHSKGKVYLLHLRNKNEQEFAKFIYGKAHLYVANTLLETIETLNENEFLKLIRQNYAKLINICDTSLGNEIFHKWWENCDYSYVKKFRLIKDKDEYTNVFIPIDQDGEKIWQLYLQNRQEHDIVKRRINFLRIRSQFYQYLISIPLRLAKKHFWDYCNGKSVGPGYIEPEMIDNYYDMQTGFNRENDEDELFIL